MAYSARDLVEGLHNIGVQQGSFLFVHSSFKSLGAVDGGAAAVIAALETVLGEAGTLLMPSFNMSSRNRTERAAMWDVARTPSSVGYLTEYFRTMPGTHRSNHYSHSVAARGALAAWLTQGHEAQEGWISPWDRLPWGRTYGTHSPMMRALDQCVEVLLLGVDYECLTYSHVAEVSDYNRRLSRDSAVPYRFTNRHIVGEWWDAYGTVQTGTIARGKIGDAESRLFNANQFVGALTAELRLRPNDFYA